MAEQLESKFREEMINHTVRWFVRLTIEPGYALRNVLSLPEEVKRKEPKNNLATMYAAAIGTEVLKLGAYGALAYKIAEHFIK
jgi:hypothetical protein